MLRKLNGLIIDDSKVSRQMIVRALEQTGLAEFSFTEAEDGLDALERFSPDDTEIIFVDMNMPRMDGLQFVRELRARHKKCPPMVMLTAEISQERLSEAFNEPGVDAVMLKPVDPDRLQSGLKKLVQSIPQKSGDCVVPHGECVPLALQIILAKLCDINLVIAADDEDVRSGKVVLGLISIHGAVDWSVTLGFTPKCAALLASKFAGYVIQPYSPDLGDAIGEITNMVAGRIKSELGIKGSTTDITLPTVISAESLQVLTDNDRPTAFTHFDSPAGKLWTTVSVGISSEVVL